MDESWRRLWVEGAVSGAAVAVTAALRSRLEGHSIWRPINAMSHMVWGWHAAKRRERTFRYTGTGLMLNMAACLFWAGYCQAWRRMMPKSASPTTAALIGVGTSITAYVTDYYVVPRRFTPGFEVSLSRRSFPWLYGALAIGLFLPQWLAARRCRSRLIRRDV